MIFISTLLASVLASLSCANSLVCLYCGQASGAVPGDPIFPPIIFNGEIDNYEE